jgi:hypothetical protein
MAKKKDKEDLIENPTLQSQLPAGWELVREDEKGTALLRLPTGSADVFERADAAIAAAGMQRVDMRSYQHHGSLVLVITGLQELEGGAA